MEIEISKKGLISEALNYGMIKIAVDTRVDGVDVPSQYMNQETVAFNVSHMFPYGDLSLGDDEMTVNLSFNKKLYPCKFPYSAINIVSDNQGNIHAFGPAGEYLMFQQTQVAPPTAKEKAAAKGFRVIDGGKDDE